MQRWRTSPVRGSSASTFTPISMDVVPTWFSPALKVIRSPKPRMPSGPLPMPISLIEAVLCEQWA